jgi:HEAT repeat protein
LREFSRELGDAVRAENAGPDLVLFADVGLGLQDESSRKSLPPEAKRIVDGLRTGSAPVEMPIGFSLLPAQFRAQSFYTQSPELSDYFAARQWYADVVFRLDRARETGDAIALAGVLDRKPELLAAWTQLSKPYDTFLGLPEDGTIRDYIAVATSVLGTNFPNGPIAPARLADIQKKLGDRLHAPRINDQLLQPDQYAQFEEVTKGFRLLPPRQLPCAVTFQNTVDPKIPGRMYPSGLDFLAASPLLRSPAAVRAVQGQFGKKTGELILHADSGPMPDSLHGEAMQLLSLLQKPLPPQTPAFMRSDAWSDLQLWTQLGAWAEQRHTWALHVKLDVEYLGSINPPRGMVAPYPDFFAGLAGLTRRTAVAFKQAGLEEKFEVKAAAAQLLESLNLIQKLKGAKMDELMKYSEKLEQLAQFQNEYYNKHKAAGKAGGSREASQQMQKDIEDLARRCAESGTANEADTEALRSFFKCRQDITLLIEDFAPVCDRLAALAKKTLNGETLTEADASWIENYGVTLAGFHFYNGNSYEDPNDDFPIVTRVFSNPLTSSVLYAGLARPQALYLVISNGPTLQLYRGAVMTYREFVRPSEKLLDDESWRELIAKGQTPPAPPFTKTFYAETSMRELVEKLEARSRIEYVTYADLEDLLWQIQARASEKDLPELFKLMTGKGRSMLVEKITEIIAPLPWEPYQKYLIELLAGNDKGLADVSGRILMERPSSLAPEEFMDGFSRQPVRARRLYCAILSRLPQTDATRNFLLQALQDPADGVRWQAALALKTAGCGDPRSQAALLKCINDTNEFVGMEAAWSLATLEGTNVAPVLLAELEARAQASNASPEEWEGQSAAVWHDINDDINRGPEYDLLNDPDHAKYRISERASERAKKMASMRLPPRLSPFAHRDILNPKYAILLDHNYTIVDALIEALGDLRYAPAADELFKLRKDDYVTEINLALYRTDPKRLTDKLLTEAKDKAADSYLREKALATLDDLSATNCVREIIPLLDDVTPIVYSRPMPWGEWRICDRAAVTIASMLGWGVRNPMILHARPEQREEWLKQARDWSKTKP